MICTSDAFLTVDCQLQVLHHLLGTPVPTEALSHPLKLLASLLTSSSLLAPDPVGEAPGGLLLLLLLLSGEADDLGVVVETLLPEQQRIRIRID